MQQINKYVRRIPLAIMFTLTMFLTTATTQATPDDHQHQGTDNKHRDIVEVAKRAGMFNTLLAALEASDLVETLEGHGPFTVFAPTDDAFSKLPRATLEELLKPENKDQLVAILTYHVAAGKIEAKDLLNVSEAETVNGQSLPIGLRIGQANVIQADIEASNGIIHVIDEVLLPASEPTTALMAMELIELAINRGVPLYNSGQAAACASVYEVAARALLQFENELPQDAQHPLRDALREMKQVNHAGEQAWIMRRGLDEAYRVLSRSKMNMAAN